MEPSHNWLDGPGDGPWEGRLSSMESRLRIMRTNHRGTKGQSVVMGQQAVKLSKCAAHGRVIKTGIPY